MDDPLSLQSGGSSPLSSLHSSPEPETRPSKRPRLSSSPPSQQPLFLAQHRSQPIEDVTERHQVQPEDLSALLEGLEDQDFDLPPSSDPHFRREDDSDPEEATEGNEPLTIAIEKRKRGAADDSGIGLLPFDIETRQKEEEEQTVDEEEKLVEPPDKVTVNDEEEFDGDDMWLGFDDADMGFDQPDAFPSSVSSLAPLPPNVTEPKKPYEELKEDAASETLEKEAMADEERLKPVDLESFGFSTVQDPTGGVMFATRKPFAPSAKSLRRAQARFGDDPFASPAAFGSPAAFVRPSRSAATLPPQPTTSTPRLSDSASRSLLPSSSSTFEEPPILAPKPERPPTAAPSLFLGFQNGFGRSIAAPSEEALMKARQRFDKSSSPDHQALTKSHSRPTSTAASRVPSRASSRASKGDVDLFGSGIENQEPKSYSLQPLALPVDSHSQSQKTHFDSPTISRTRSFLKAEELDSNTEFNGRRSPLAPVENIAPLVSEEDPRSDHESSTTTLNSSSPHKRETSPISQQPQPESRPPLSPNPKNHSASAIFAIPSPPRPPSVAPRKTVISDQSLPTRGTPGLDRRTPAFRSPMLNSTRNASQASSSTPRLPSSLSARSSVFPIASTSAALTSTPLFNRRLNIGMTPRNKPFHLANTLPSASAGKTRKATFVTPFKGGKRPEGLTPTGLKEQNDSAKAVVARDILKVTPAASEKKQTRVSQLGGGKGKETKAKIFDLSSEQPRFSLFDYGMRPQTHLFEELETRGFSEEILSMNAESATKFVFPCGRSVKDAFTSLKALVAARSPGEENLVTLPWVQNHWELIVWKLACYVRTRPDLLDKWWNFVVVVDQLRYRYEREINQAQRAAIKRIQERDSPASLPMILCVSQLLWDDPDDVYDNSDASTQVIVGLELTDGWYRIRAIIDPTLKSACERGKLIVGSKLAIVGARLDKSRQEGIDVLEALGRSKLVISGNSTSLASWHATLGFSRTQFFASLDSLSSAGGSVAPLDIIVEKIFELGYVDAMRSNSGTWGEAEEREKAEDWARGREKISARMQDAAEKTGVDEDDLVVLLQDLAEGSREDGIPPDSEADGDDDDPEEIIERLGAASSKRAILRRLPPRSLQACLAFAIERAHRSRKQAYDDLKEELDKNYPPRQVRSVRMMRIKDAREGSNGTSDREAILTVWDVKNYASDFFREGKRYLVTNTVVKGTWQRKHKEITLHTKKDSKWTRV